MTKQISILIACLCLTIAGFAQKSNIQSTLNYLKDNDLEKARKLIDETVQNESTKTNAKAWMLRAVIYQAIVTPAEFMPKMTFILNDNPMIIDLATANSLSAANPNAFNESLTSFQKALSFDPKYSKEEIAPLLSGLVILAYNQGVAQMNSSKFVDAAKSFDDVISVSNIDAGKPFKGAGAFDTIFANSKILKAKSFYQTGKEDEALPMLEEAVKNPIVQDADVFVMLTEIYDLKNNQAKWLETMKLARAKYPNDKRLIDNEIGFYRKNGKEEELIAKLKEGIAADPKRTDNYLILGQTYYYMANPQDKAQKPLPQPVNAAELEQNALTNYTKALEIDGGNNMYGQYYSAVLHFNNAKIINDQMNKENDDAKYQTMLTKRNQKLDLAIPFFLKAKELIEKEGVNDSNKLMYKDVLSGLAQSYMITDKPDKSTEMNNLLKTVK